MDTNVVLICPCCASPVDARTGDHPEDFECVSCGQMWTMVVDADRHAAHALT